MYPVPVVFKHQSDLFSGATTSVSLGKLFKKYPSLGHIPGDSDSVCLVQSPGILFSKKKKKNDPWVILTHYSILSISNITGFS